jgi:serine/threonine protein phosphatase PrpC
MMEFAVAPGDRIVLCSDGLWDELTPQAIGQLIAEATSPRGCASELVALANAAGGNDNSTAVAIFIEAEPDDIALPHRAAHGWPSNAENTEYAEGAQDHGETEAGQEGEDATASADDATPAEPPATAE